MTYLLDSDILIDFFKHHGQAKQLVQRLSNEGVLAFSTISITELRSGWTQEQARQLLPQLYALGGASSSPQISQNELAYGSAYLPKDSSGRRQIRSLRLRHTSKDIASSRTIAKTIQCLKSDCIRRNRVPLRHSEKVYYPGFVYLDSTYI